MQQKDNVRKRILPFTTTYHPAHPLVAQVNAQNTFLFQPYKLRLLSNLQLRLQLNPHLWHQHSNFHLCPQCNHDCQVLVCSLGTAAVSSSVNSIHIHHTGELNPPSSPPSSLFTSSALPVNVRVSQKLKSKIWANKYIDFGSLLVNPLSVNKYHVTF